MYMCIGKSNVYVIFDRINWRDTLLLGAHDFGGTTTRAARRRINIPTLQSYRLWSLLSARHVLRWVLRNKCCSKRLQITLLNPSLLNETANLVKTINSKLLFIQVL